MPSTYTVNLGIEKPATGEQSGTWGDTTNVNFDIIDQAVNGSERVTLTSAGTSGSPNDLNIVNGSTTSSEGRNKWLEIYSASDLGGSAYVRLVPNDAEKILFIRNSLAGSQSVLLFQGTYNASNDLEIPAGVDMVVKFDGAGASATVTDVFTKLRATEITTPTLTAGTADINGGSVDGATVGAASASTGAFTTLTASTNLNIAASTTVDGILDEDNMASDSATKLATQQSIKAYVDSQVGTVDTLAEILANGNTSGANNLIIDNGQALTSNTINETTAGSGVTIDSVLLKDDGVNATNLEITNIKANDGTAAATIANSTGNFTITNFISNSVDIGGGAIDGTVIGGSTAAAGTFTTGQFNTSLNVDGTVTADGLTVDGAALVRSGNTLTLNRTDNAVGGAMSYVAGTGFIFNDVNGDGTSFNEGATNKFRIDSSGNVGIGTSSPQSTYKLTISGTDSVFPSVYLENTTNSKAYSMRATGTSWIIRDNTVGADRLNIDSSGNVGIGTSSPSALLQLEGSDGTPQLKFLRTGTNIGGIIRQTSSPYGLTYDAIDGNAGAPTHVFRTSVDGSSFTERMRIDSSGNVGIGTTVPAEALTVNGNIGIGSGKIFNGTASNSAGILFASSTVRIDGYSGITFHSSATTVGSQIERMRIDSSGNVGIGTSSPSLENGSGLVVYNATTPRISLKNSTTGTTGLDGVDIAMVSSDAYFFNREAGAVILGTTSLERMRMSSAGALQLSAASGVSSVISRTTAPAGSQGLNITAGVVTGLPITTPTFADNSSSGATIYLAGNSVDPYGGNLQLFAYGSGSTAANIISFHNRSGAGTTKETMRIDSSGNVGIGTSSPAAKLDVQSSSSGVVATISGPNAYNAESGLLFSVGRAKISGFLNGTGGTPGTSLRFYTMPDSGSVTERMRIDSSGLLKIGTSGTVTPYSLSRFAIDTGTYAYMDLLSTGSSGINFGDAGGAQRGTIEYDHGSDFMRFGSAGAERMRIDSSGNLLVGTTAAVGKFSIEAVPTGTARSVDYSATGGTVDYYIVDNVNVGSISVTTTATAYNTSSDERLKENITDANDAGDKIDAIKVRQYDWKADGSHQDYGMVAQELMTVAPEAVSAPEDPEK
jgi:hypothetical protein